MLPAIVIAIAAGATSERFLAGAKCASCVSCFPNGNSNAYQSVPAGGFATGLPFPSRKGAVDGHPAGAGARINTYRMNRNNLNTSLDRLENHCPVCGQRRYMTNRGDREWTLHCSSLEARFWNFERGSFAETIARQHWIQSRLVVRYRREDREKTASLA